MKIFKLLLVTFLFGAMPLFASETFFIERPIKRQKLAHIGLAEFQDAIQAALEISTPEVPAINQWTPEEDAIIQNALAAVETLGGYSFELSFPLQNSDFLLEEALHTIQNHPQISFLVPLISTLIQHLRSRGILLSHFAIRIDPDTSCMFRKKKGTKNNRKETHLWHHHDSHSYLFVLSTAQDVATEVREENGIEHCIPLLELFFLDGQMNHRTPVQTEEQHKRVHFSFGVLEEDQEDIL